MAEGGSKKGKTMSLNEFLGDSGSSSGGSWADRTDDHEPRGGSSYGDRGGDRGGYGGDRGGRGGYGDRGGGDRGGRGGYGDRGGGDRYGGGGDRYGGGGDRYGGGGDRYGGGGDRYGGGGRGGGGGGYGGDRGGYGGGAREDRYGGAERGPSRDPPDNPPFIAFVGNLSFDLQEDELFDFFTSGGCKVKTARMISDQFTGRSKGFGYIEFEDKESLVVALDADREELNGRSLRVDVAEERQSAEFGESRADKVDRWERGRAVAREERDSGRDRPMRGGDRGDDRGGRYGDRGGDRGADGPRGRPRVALTKAVAAPKKKSNPFGDATPIKSKADMLVEEQAKKAAAAKAKKDAEEAKKAAEAPAEAPADDAAPADAAPADDAAAEVAEVAEKVADVKVEE